MNQRVLVTAGASGIGREIVRAFAAQGAKVFVCAIDARGLDPLAQEIPGLATKVGDISSREDIERIVPSGVDALVCIVSLLPDGQESVRTVAVTQAVLQAIDERRRGRYRPWPSRRAAAAWGDALGQAAAPLAAFVRPHQPGLLVLLRRVGVEEHAVGRIVRARVSPPMTRTRTWSKKPVILSRPASIWWRMGSRQAHEYTAHSG
jgi:hypothetical protein